MYIFIGEAATEARNSHFPMTGALRTNSISLYYNYNKNYSLHLVHYSCIKFFVSFSGKHLIRKFWQGALPLPNPRPSAIDPKKHFFSFLAAGFCPTHCKNFTNIYKWHPIKPSHKKSAKKPRRRVRQLLICSRVDDAAKPGDWMKVVTWTM